MSAKGHEMNDDLDPRDRALQAKLREAFDPVLDEPVPERLKALFKAPAQEKAPAPASAPTPTPGPASTPASTPAIDLDRERLRRRGGWLAWGGIAASLVLGMAIGSKWMAPGSELDRADNGDWVARGGLASALDSQLSGAPTATSGGTRIGLSFVARDGAYCRAFSQGESGQNGSAGVACRDGEGWRVKQLVAVAVARASSSSSNEFRTAASPWPPALMGTIDDLREGDALGPEAERAAMSKGWKR